MDEKGLEARAGQQLRPCELHVSESLLKCVSKYHLPCQSLSAGKMSCCCVRFEPFFIFGVFAIRATQSILRDYRTFAEHLRMNRG